MWNHAPFTSCSIGMAYILLVSVAHGDPEHMANLSRVPREAQQDNVTLSSNLPVETLLGQEPAHDPSTTIQSISVSSPKDSLEEEDRRPPKNGEKSFWTKLKGKVKESAVGGARQTKENWRKGVAFLRNWRKTLTGRERDNSTENATTSSLEITEDVEEKEEKEGNGEEESGEEDSQESRDDLRGRQG